MKKRSLMSNTNEIYFFLISCFVLIRLITSLVSVSGFVGNVLNVFLQIGIMFFLPFFLYKIFMQKNSKQVFSDFQFNKISFKAIFISVCLGVCVYILNLAVATLFNVVIAMFGYDPYFGFMLGGSEQSISFVVFLSNVFMTAILPGFCEEFAHRGLLLNGFKSFGAKKAIILSGILFGLMHLNIEQCFYASAIGIFLGFLAVTCKSIFPCMIIHFMNNFISVYLSYASSNNLFGGNVSNAVSNFLSKTDAILVLFLIFVVITLLIFLLIFLTTRLIKATTFKQIENELKNQLSKTLPSKQTDDAYNQTENITIENAETRQTQNDVLNKKVDKINLKNLYSQNLYQFFFFDFKEKPINKKDLIFLYGTLFVGIIINFSTFLWGAL